MATKNVSEACIINRIELKRFKVCVLRFRATTDHVFGFSHNNIIVNYTRHVLPEEISPLNINIVFSTFFLNVIW